MISLDRDCVIIPPNRASRASFVWEKRFGRRLASNAVMRGELVNEIGGVVARVLIP
jgi:hypothetical protein